MGPYSKAPSSKITTVEDLEVLYGVPNLASTVKVSNRITPAYAALITASPFLALATVGPEGLDCSPRGDRTGELVRVADPKTVLLPDRRGNNRIDSLRNIVRDPRLALLFLIPGSGTTLRINGRGEITAAPDLLASFAVQGQGPRSVVSIAVDEVYFQCARAVVRSGLWDSTGHVDPAALPTPGDILDEMSRGEVGGAAYDQEWPERARGTLW
jgi:PPOX class probable FMN-dependent enzyme